jgi:glutaredoxin 3
MQKATFFHAGCPVCVSAEQELLQLTDTSKVNVEVVHLGEQPLRIDEAEKAGVKSVPALVLENGQVLHINFGASLADVRG